MKNLISVFLACILMLSFASAAFAAAPVKGDVNFDGSVTTADARLCLRRAIDLESYPAASREYKACDVDKDGVVKTGDARFILRHAIGLNDPKIVW